MSWCRQHIGSENRPYVVKGVKVHGQSIEWTHPPSPRFRLVFPDASYPPLSPSLSLSLLLSPSVSWNITVGQKSPHWRLRGCIMRINELEVNMQAVCCLPLYTSQPIGFHQKLRWIVSQKKAQTMPRSVLFIQSRISKAISKDLTSTFIPIRNILFIRFVSPSLVFISSEGDGDDPVCEIAFVVSFHT